MYDYNSNYELEKSVTKAYVFVNVISIHRLYLFPVTLWHNGTSLLKVIHEQNYSKWMTTY